MRWARVRHALGEGLPTSPTERPESLRLPVSAAQPSLGVARVSPERASTGSGDPNTRSAGSRDLSRDMRFDREIPTPGLIARVQKISIGDESRLSS